MVVLASSLLHSGLVLIPPISCQTSLSLSSSSSRSSNNNSKISAWHFVEPKFQSWSPIFLFRSAQKKDLNPLIEDSPSPGSATNSNEDEEAVSFLQRKRKEKKATKGRNFAVFTPQKARELRRRLRDTDSFHDFMYHSSIASRLANEDR